MILNQKIPSVSIAISVFTKVYTRVMLNFTLVHMLSGYYFIGAITILIAPIILVFYCMYIIHLFMLFTLHYFIELIDLSFHISWFVYSSPQTF